jgi:hypothetical protein
VVLKDKKEKKKKWASPRLQPTYLGFAVPKMFSGEKNWKEILLASSTIFTQCFLEDWLVEGRTRQWISCSDPHWDKQKVCFWLHSFILVPHLCTGNALEHEHSLVQTQTVSNLGSTVLLPWPVTGLITAMWYTFHTACTNYSTRQAKSNKNTCPPECS